MNKSKALIRAIKAAGGAMVLARKIKVSHQAVFKWPRVPAERVMQVERHSGVPRCLLRPDLYPMAREHPLRLSPKAFGNGSGK
mgnify:CR=1 FL=1